MTEQPTEQPTGRDALIAALILERFGAPPQHCIDPAELARRRRVLNHAMRDEHRTKPAPP